MALVRLIEAGMSIVDLAGAEKVDKSYLCRLLRLTLLSPAITEAILEGTLPKDVLLVDLVGSSELDWAEQNRSIRGSASAPASEEKGGSMLATSKS